MADPASLTIAFHPPAASITFRGGIEPFAAAVTREAAGALALRLCPDGALGGLLTTRSRWSRAARPMPPS